MGGTIEPISIVYIYDKSGKILLTKNSELKGGKWGVPGGHIEFGENIFSAAKREAMEEVGLNVTPIGVFGINENVPKDPTRKHFILFHIICLTDSAEVKIDNKELVEYVWATPEDSKEILHGGTYNEIISEYSKQLKKGKVDWVFIPKI